MSEQQQDTAKYVVGDDEIVYRLISSPAGYNEITGVSPDCFKLFRKNESYVSVERARYCSLDDALSNGENIKKWFAESESFWGVASLSVKKIRQHKQLDVISKYTESHPGHAGIQMKLSEEQVYKNKEGEPTPMEILALQTYLSGIIDQVVKKDSRKDQEQIVKESLTKAFDEFHSGKSHHDAHNLFKK
jgi:hypothetical protein